MRWPRRDQLQCERGRTSHSSTVTLCEGHSSRTDRVECRLLDDVPDRDLVGPHPKLLLGHARTTFPYELIWDDGLQYHHWSENPKHAAPPRRHAYTYISSAVLHVRLQAGDRIYTDEHAHLSAATVSSPLPRQLIRCVSANADRPHIRKHL